MLQKKFVGLLGVSPLALLVACSGGGGGGTGVESSALTSAVSDVPVAGQFLAECVETGTAVIEGFVQESPLPIDLGDVPSIDTVLAAGDPDQIPVIGGLVPDAGDPSTLVPISIDEALSMIPTTGLPADLPTIGAAPVSCSDVALPSDELPIPTDAVGLVPVFDEAGDPVALVLATVGEAQGSLPDVTDVELPADTDTLPEPFGSTVGSILSLLGL